MAAVKGPQHIQSDIVSLNDREHHPTVALGSLINETLLAEKATEEVRLAFEIEEHPIDQVRPIKVGVIGAGLAGITAGILLPAKLPGLDLRIYEKNSDVVCNCWSIIFINC